MLNVLDIGRSGLNAMQYNLDLASNDIANSNTYGYKRKMVGFNELLINEIVDTEVLLGANAQNSGINAGTKAVTSTVDFSQGTLEPTESVFEMAIEGPGLFGVRDNDGNLFYTRDGDFYLDSENNVVNSSGHNLEMTSYVAKEDWDGSEITIDSYGRVVDNRTNQQLAQINLFRPENMDSLFAISNSRYFNTDQNLYNSQDNPEMFGAIRSNMLERSNVELSDGMVDLITTQRAYSLNAKVVHNTDEVLGLINGMKR